MTTPSQFCEEEKVVESYLYLKNDCYLTTETQKQTDSVVFRSLITRSNGIIGLRTYTRMGGKTDAERTIRHEQNHPIDRHSKNLITESIKTLLNYRAHLPDYSRKKWGGGRESSHIAK